MTIREIAEIAGVSQGTVSKVLNHRDASISEETRKKVLRIAKEQHYRPYAEALKAYQQNSHLLGLLVYKDHQLESKILVMIEEALFANGYSLMTGFYDSTVSMKTQLQGMAAKHASLVMISGPEEAFSLLDDQITEAFSVCRIEGAQTGGLPCFILQDIVQKTKIAADYLLQAGHKEIALVSADMSRRSELLRGYQWALYENGIPYDERNVSFDCNSLALAESVSLLLFNKNVTAIICDKVELASGLYRACERQGLRIPEDMSIICLEDSQVAAISQPSLTVVGQDIRPRVDAFVRCILNHLEKGTRIKAASDDIGYFILERDSVAAPVKERLMLTEKILVLGSMNIDETIYVHELPTDGETLLCDSKVIVPGGKGANQAVGAAKLGGNVSMIGCLGNDFEGRRVFSFLKKCGVNTDAVSFDMELPTGKAFVQAAENGESTIVVYPGANKKLDVDYIRKFEYMFGDARLCLLPIEILAAPMLYALDICKQRGIVTIIKPSLHTHLPENVLSGIDYLVPNEKELYHLLDGEGIEDRAARLFSQGVSHVIVTLGHRGCYLKDREYSLYIPAVDFNAVDVTGAADAFIAALAVALNHGDDIVTAICSATYAAGISITRMGVQTALADELTIEAYRDSIRKMASELKEGIG